MELDGQQFNHYRVLRSLGQGNIGEVYLAEDLQLQQQVALKTINIDALHREKKAAARAIRLFLRAMASRSRLDHPHILPLYHYGVEEFQGAHFVYLVMPYRSEGSLLAWLSQRAQSQPQLPLTPQQIIHIMRQAGAALYYAHNHHNMHLDVKPANVLIRNRSTIDEYPDLLLSDFGMASLSGPGQYERFAPLYIAPEQLKKRAVFASDQYALAILAYELLTGYPPFQGEPARVIAGHCLQLPAAVSEQRPLLPPAVDLVLRRALEKKPGRRFPSVIAFAEAFQKALQGVPASALLPVSRTITAVPATPDIPPTDGDVRATLVLSKEEAQHGTLRTLTLPCGSRINLYLPAGMMADEVIFLQGQGERPAPDAVAGNLYITLAVQTTSQPLPAELTDVTMPVRDFASAQTLSMARPVSASPALMGTRPRDADQPSEGTDSAYHALEESSSMSLSHEPKQPKSRSVIIAMLLLVCAGVGIGAYSVISSNMPFLQNSAQASTPAPAPTRTPTAHPPTTAATWHVQASGVTQELTSLAWADNHYVAVGSPGVVLTSSDGHTWVSQISGTEESLWSVAWSGSMLVAVGTGGTILTSPDGQAWTTQKSGTTQDLWSVVFGDGFLFVVTGTNGTILTSHDGVAWTQLHVSSGQILDSVIWTGKQYVAVGDNGLIFTSPDADTWTMQKSGTNQLLESVFWASTQYVAVGANGTILTSPDGEVWTLRQSGTTQDLTGVVWVASRFTAIGDQGTILTSADGKTWSAQNAGTTQRLWSVIHQGAQYVAVGNHGTILTTP